MTTCDVLVVGGGSGGLAAAIAAARSGAETILVERDGQLGGMGATALVHTICGLYLIREELEPQWANDGFARSFAERLMATGGARQPQRMGRLDVLPHEPTAFAAMADQIVSETPRLRLWMHGEVARVEGDFDRVEILCGGRVQSVKSGAYIDASGDATLAALGGAAFQQEKSETLQRPAYIVRVGGLSEEIFSEEGRFALAHSTVSSVQAGRLPREAMGSGWRKGVPHGDAFLTIDLMGDSGSGEAWDPFSPEMLANAEMTGRRTALALIDHVKNNIKGCSACRVLQWPTRLGIRESRRALGVYEISEDDILRGASFDDGIARAAWPIELRNRPTGPRWKYPDLGKTAQIPLRALRHRDVENLWFAGRCISCSHEAQGSIRVMGTCLAAGEAAGFAAAASLDGFDGWKNLAERVKKLQQVEPSF